MMDDESSQAHSDASGEKRGKNKRQKKRKTEKLKSGKDDAVVSRHFYGLLYLARNNVLQLVIFFSSSCVIFLQVSI